MLASELRKPLLSCPLFRGLFDFVDPHTAQPRQFQQPDDVQ
jgi:hypothetical protein